MPVSHRRAAATTPSASTYHPPPSAATARPARAARELCCPLVYRRGRSVLSTARPGRTGGCVRAGTRALTDRVVTAAPASSSTNSWRPHHQTNRQLC